MSTNINADKREFTITSIILGIIISLIFGAANAYLGLRVGLTISASIPAAVVSMGVLRFVMRRDSILENNMVQTIGSAGTSIVSGSVFTMPALYLWAEEGLCAPPGFVQLTIIALCGSVLGVLLMVPVRRPFIVDEDKTLAYPEGRACAEVLRAGENGAKQSRDVFIGVAVAVLVKLITDVFKWLPAVKTFKFTKLRGEMGVELSSALIGVGYIVGPKVSTLVFVGSILGWMVLIPLFCLFSEQAAACYDHGGATAVWKNYIRYVGAGAIATGGIISLFKTIPTVVSAFREAFSLKVSSEKDDKADISLKKVIPGVIATILIIALVPQVPVGILGALLIALFGFFFAIVSSRMVGLVGSSNNPISGMTIVTLVISALVLKTCGVAGAAGMVAAIAVGSLVCIIASLAGDTAQDLKTGWMLGATPWKQQIGELIGAGSAAFMVAVVLLLLHKAWGFGSDEISAPQAMLMKSVTEGIMQGTLPWGLLLMGCGIAGVIALLRLPVMPCALGIYLPIKLNMTIFIGGMLRVLFEKYLPTQAPRGTLFSAGMIAGEGIAGIVLALITVLV
ncbi:MAG: oligopeptide transporter, OPT family [Kiritimatiellae bacterium]|nr:oligopeptide transporter, OPT family [Kiritimatiellia bacterium]